MSSKGRGLVCMFCGEAFGYAGQTPDEETLRAAVAHEKDCAKNPYKAEIARLTASAKDLQLQAVKGLFRKLSRTNYVEVGDLMKAICSHIELMEKGTGNEDAS